MSLRDLVAADCAAPNPLARFMQGFSNDKVGMHQVQTLTYSRLLVLIILQDQWIDQRDSSSDAGPSLTAFERLKMKEQQEKEEVYSHNKLHKCTYVDNRVICLEVWTGTQGTLTP